MSYQVFYVDGNEKDVVVREYADKKVAEQFASHASNPAKEGSFAHYGRDLQVRKGGAAAAEPEPEVEPEAPEAEPEPQPDGDDGLEALSYKALQKAAKEAGVSAGGTAEELVERVRAARA